MESKTHEPAYQPVTEQVQEAARKGVEQSYTLSKQILDAWVASSEATLKASFDLQNTAIATGRSLLGPADNYSQAIYKQWADTIGLAQKATLDALEATKKLSSQFGPKADK